MADLKTRPYDGPGDDSLPDAVKKLPKEAREIWVSAFNSAWKNYDPETSEQDSQEGYARAVAWGAVNKNFKKVDGKWQRRSYVQGEFDSPFTSVNRADDGAVAWKTTCSNDGVDNYATRMTTDLHDDFIRNAERLGMPWLTVAHFNKLARIGRATKLYRDGRRLKAEGEFFTTDAAAERHGFKPDDLSRDLAHAAAEAALEDLRLPPRERRIRTSIGFKPGTGAIEMEDLGVLAYVRGVLPEITMTTHPGNSRVDFSSERRSGEMQVRISPDFMEADAASIVGEALAKGLRKKIDHLTGDEERSDEDAVDLIFRSLDEAESQARLIAAGQQAAASKDEEARKGVAKLYAEAGRTVPWERKADSMIDRLEEIDDLRILEDAGLVDEKATQRARDQLSADIASGKVTDFSEIEVEQGEEGEGVNIRSKWGQVHLPLIQRIGKRLQGAKLDELDKVATSLASAAETVKGLVEWARAEKEEGERSYQVREIEPTADLIETLKERYYGDMEPDTSLIETMEFQEMANLVMNATFTLADIVVANMTPENEISMEDRMQNIEGALGEYAQVVNGILVSAFGGGRSGTDNRNDMAPSNSGNGQRHVKPTGKGAGPVNPKGTSAGQPDLQTFDDATAKLRQVVLDQGTTEQLQEAFNEIGAAIEEAVPADEGPVDEHTEQRLDNIERGLSEVTAVLHELAQERSRAPDQPEQPERRPVPRRRSLPPGPPPAETPPVRNPQEGHSRLGGAKRFKIEEVVRQRPGQLPTYP